MLQLARSAGVEMVHVPYRGGGPAVADAMAGHVDLVIGSAALITPLLKANRLRGLVQFGPSRLAAFVGTTNHRGAWVSRQRVRGLVGSIHRRWYPKAYHRALSERVDLRTTRREHRTSAIRAHANQIDARRT